MKTSGLIAILSVAFTAAKWIVPGSRWLDTDGNLISAHGGNVIVEQATGKFFWFGEIKSQIEGESDRKVAVYSSDDLASWKSHGLAYEAVESDEIPGVSRPKVLFSKETNKYHMWWHGNNLTQALATSDNIEGPYVYQKFINPVGNWSQDFGAFTDYKTGESYSLYSNGDSVDGRDCYISKFTSDLTDVKEVTFRFNKYDLEAPSILQTEKSYYALMSHKTGYRPNNVVAFRADKLEGPWSQPFFISPAYTRTFNTQSGFVLRIEGSKKTTHLYIADQWDSNSLWESRDVWLPVKIDDKKGSLEVVWNDVYDLNVKTGEWHAIKGRTYNAKSARLAGDAFFQEANFGSDNIIATSIYGNDSTITFEVEGNGGDQWVSFYYQNIDDMGFGDQPGGTPDRIGGKWQLRRISSVVVNNDTDTVHTLYQRDTHKGIILSTPLKLPLKNGRNTITIGGLYNGADYKGADIDRIVVYPREPKNHLS